MNALLVFTVLFAGACMADVSHVVNQKPVIEILKYNQDARPEGDWNLDFETQNGIVTKMESDAAGEMRGEYHYIDPEGKPVDVTWVAGRNGFVAQGSSIPAVPDTVVRALKYIEEHPYKEPVSKP
ncbi:larval cuticle protein LCP-17 [Neodiprion lecontei]|uniref:Larval cuticle protein LCP-17 n=1 Tax=Neodiprion lecontei TaxID=441921 RepID=A0A6J0BUV5_NEOLC|nr:larval cuticle protein LCP-17 [Neodiprion lecontei]